MKILNVGCGNEKYGTDFIDMYPQRKEVIRCNIDKDNFPFDSEIFDKVYSKNLLEHLRNPLHFFNEAKRVLKKGGALEVITDNAHFLGFHIIMGVHAGNYEKGHQVGGVEDSHFSLFTPYHLYNHLSKSGFSNITVKFMNDKANDFVGFMMVVLAFFKKKQFSGRIIGVGVKSR